MKSYRVRAWESSKLKNFWLTQLAQGAFDLPDVLAAVSVEDEREGLGVETLAPVDGNQRSVGLGALDDHHDQGAGSIE